MSLENKKNNPEEIDWEALEAEDKKMRVKPNTEELDEEKIEREKKLLSEEEKASPYPDDFLADINGLNKEINAEDTDPFEEE
ncbi:hypothetical protein [Flexithrix dorotheae]|uniref:hypothetical protein n=1 Tax=Flexithrix dorotheae TaxID=70993 RepID=UPI000362B446|nr:hypothetical protein [Flexithrix dorotheae]